MKMLDDVELVIDDELDAFNSETFGDDCEDYTWDESQNVLEDIDKHKVNGTFRNEQGKGARSHDETFARFLQDEDDLEDFDDPSYMAVKESISRLVFDDDLDDVYSNQPRMQATHSSLMPPQVANKHLNWFKNDLGDPLFGSSVWSMHPTDTLSSTPAKASVSDSAIVRPPETNKLNLDSVAKIQENTPHRPPPGLGKGASRFRYLEDVEQELLSASPQTPNEKVSTEPTPITPKDVEDKSGPVKEILGIHQERQIYPQGVAHVPQPDFPPQFYQQRQFPMGMRPGFPINPNVLFHQRFPQGLPPGIFPMIPQMNANMSANQAAFIAMQQQQHQLRMRMQQMNQHLAMFPNRQHLPRPGQMPDMNSPSPNSNAQHHKRDHIRQGKLGDPYAGLMTDRDKQRMKNIQMVQLQNDHPFTTDYYYQMKQYNLTRSTSHLAKLFPGDNDGSNKNNYEPTRFENALGKLQAVSALAPKKIIDTYIQVHATTVHGPNHKTRYLLQIEAVYNLFLDVKEIEYRKSAGTWSERDAKEKKDIKAYIDLGNKLRQYEFRLSEWLSIRKGRILVFNLINCFREIPNAKCIAYTTFANILKYMKTSDMKRLSEGDQDSKAFSFVIQDLISQAKFQDLNLLFDSCKPNIWESRFGTTCFLALLERACTKSIRDIAPEFWNGNWSESESIEGILLNGFQKIPKLLKQFLSTSTSKITAPLIPPDESCLIELSLIFGIVESGTKIKDLLNHFSATYNSSINKTPGAYDDIPY